MGLSHTFLEGVKTAMSVLFKFTLDAERSDLADNTDVLSRSIATLEKGVSGSSFLQSHKHHHPHKEGTDVHDVHSGRCTPTG